MAIDYRQNSKASQSIQLSDSHDRVIPSGVRHLDSTLHWQFRTIVSSQARPRRFVKRAQLFAALQKYVMFELVNALRRGQLFLASPGHSRCACSYFSMVPISNT